MSLVYNQEAINGILYFLHSQKVTSADAHQKLIETAGEEVMDLKEIDNFYKKMENGKYALKMEKEVTLDQVMVRVPNFVQDYVDVETRLRLRKTSPHIRQLLDTETQRIEKFIYEYGRDYIRFSADNNFDVKYDMIDGGIIVRNNWNLELIKTEHDRAKKGIIKTDLMAFFVNEKLKIDTLKIKEVRGRRKYHELTFPKKALIRGFDEMPKKLKVRKLIYQVKDADDYLVETIKRLDPNHLEFLRIVHQETHSDRISFDGELYDLPQWKNVKKVYVNHYLFIFREIIDRWTHFEYARLKYQHSKKKRAAVPIHEEVLELVKKLRENPNLDYYQIQFQGLSVADYNRILETLRTANIPNTTKSLGRFKYSKSDEAIELIISENSLYFAYEDDTGDDSEDEDYEYNKDD